MEKEIEIRYLSENSFWMHVSTVDDKDIFRHVEYDEKEYIWRKSSFNSEPKFLCREKQTETKRKSFGKSRVHTLCVEMKDSI